MGMRVLELDIESEALRNNPLGDPYRRTLSVLVPEDLHDGETVPCVWWLAGYAGTGRQMLAHDQWQEGLGQRLDRLRSEGRIGKMVVALPDAFTALGGCQYLSSPAVGDYETYLWKELPEVLSAHVRVGNHGVAGKSSGGFGAFQGVLRNPGLFQAMACHSGDMGFELSMFPGLVTLMDAIYRYGSLKKVVEAHKSALNKREGKWFGPLSMIALAAVYSPNISQPLGIELPFEPKTGRLRPEVLARWKQFDPVWQVETLESAKEALSGLKLLFLDCGNRDEHALHWGARQLSHALNKKGVKHEYLEFDGGHRSTSYRLDVSFPKLYSALS